MGSNVTPRSPLSSPASRFGTEQRSRSSGKERTHDGRPILRDTDQTSDHKPKYLGTYDGCPKTIGPEPWLQQGEPHYTVCKSLPRMRPRKLTAVFVPGLLHVLHLPQARYPVNKLPRRRGGIRRALPPPSHPSPTPPRRFSCRMLFPTSTRSHPQVGMRQACCRSHTKWIRRT